MSTLITPAPERALWHFPDKEALKEWAWDRSMHWKLRENLSQLLGFDDIGSSGARTGHEREDYFLLQDITWMYHEKQRDVIPLFGTGPKKYQQLTQRVTNIGFKLRKFQKMLASKGTRSDDGWWVGEQPAAVASLPNGSSVFGIARVPKKTFGRPPEAADMLHSCCCHIRSCMRLMEP